MSYSKRSVFCTHHIPALCKIRPLQHVGLSKQLEAHKLTSHLSEFIPALTHLLPEYLHQDRNKRRRQKFSPSQKMFPMVTPAKGSFQKLLPFQRAGFYTWVPLVSLCLHLLTTFLAISSFIYLNINDQFVQILVSLTTALLNLCSLLFTLLRFLSHRGLAQLSKDTKLMKD